MQSSAEVNQDAVNHISPSSTSTRTCPAAAAGGNGGSRKKQKTSAASASPKHCCEWKCGFTGGFDQVSEHERTCAVRI